MSKKKRIYFFTDVPAADRFLDGDKPSEQEFRNLLDSIAFLDEQSDEATTAKRGLVVIAPSSYAKSLTPTKNGSILVTTPAHLPEVLEDDGSVIVTTDQTGNNNKYKLKVDFSKSGIVLPSVGPWIDINASPAGAPAYYSGWQGVEPIPGSTSAYRDLGNGLIEVNLYAQSLSNSNVVAKLPIAIAPSRVAYIPVNLQNTLPANDYIPGLLAVFSDGSNTQLNLIFAAGVVYAGLSLYANFTYQKG